MTRPDAYQAVESLRARAVRHAAPDAPQGADFVPVDLWVIDFYKLRARTKVYALHNPQATPGAIGSYLVLVGEYDPSGQLSPGLVVDLPDDRAGALKVARVLAHLAVAGHLDHVPVGRWSEGDLRITKWRTAIHAARQAGEL